MIKKELFVVIELVFQNNILKYTDVWGVTDNKQEAIGMATEIHFDETHGSCIEGLTDNLDRDFPKEVKQYEFDKYTRSYIWSTEYSDINNTRIEIRVMPKDEQGL